MFERADRKSVTISRKITLRGKQLNVYDPEPVAIARALKKSRRKTVKERGAGMEAKFAGR